MAMTAHSVSPTCPRLLAGASLLVPAVMFAGCQTAPGSAAGARQSQRAPSSTIPHVVTADIQAGIEKHIAEQTELGSGYFNLPFEGETLRLKLVRVHTEYLASLGPTRQFACVDLAATDGNVYDVDFFLEGGAGDMTVTETTVHKINGQPLYLWEQLPDKTWVRADVDDATPALLGVVEGTDRFEFIYQATLPRLTGDARMWIPLPSTDAFQSIDVERITTPATPGVTQRILTDQRYGNKVLYLELTPEDSGEMIELIFDVHRREKTVYEHVHDERGGGVPDDFLAPEEHVPINDEFRQIADDVLQGRQQNDLVRARALYDHTIDRMRYIKAGEGWGQGDAVRAATALSGNCTDYHAYFIALARASGIPARFAIGAAVPSSRDDGGVDGYHCWAEFYAEGKWWPVDISEADKYTALATYYFGRHPANRVELSRGRDLLVDPGPTTGPINFLAYPVLEVAGRPVAIKPKFGFRRMVE